MSQRFLAVDPGDKRIGLAISDPTGTIASPLSIILHEAREKDAARIIGIAKEHQASGIVVGIALDSNGDPGPRARKATRLAEVIRQLTEIQVILWDESGTTQQAKSAYVKMNIPKKKRSGHLDDIAATVLLQSYLDHLSDEAARFETH
jgi:putative Holliday junction resolvase